MSTIESSSRGSITVHTASMPPRALAGASSAPSPASSSLLSRSASPSTPRSCRLSHYARLDPVVLPAPSAGSPTCRRRGRPDRDGLGGTTGPRSGGGCGRASATTTEPVPDRAQSERRAQSQRQQSSDEPSPARAQSHGRPLPCHRYRRHQVRRRASRPRRPVVLGRSDADAGGDGRERPSFRVLADLLEIAVAPLPPMARSWLVAWAAVVP